MPSSGMAPMAPISWGIGVFAQYIYLFVFQNGILILNLI